MEATIKEAETKKYKEKLKEKKHSKSKTTGGEKRNNKTLKTDEKLMEK